MKCLFVKKILLEKTVISTLHALVRKKSINSKKFVKNDEFLVMFLSNFLSKRQVDKVVLEYSEVL